MKFVIYLKGILMGICDLIPGISGGTIAFITGIYARLITAVKSFSLILAKNLFLYSVNRDNKSRLTLKESIKKLDLGFLIILFAGIGTSLLLGSRIIDHLLEKYTAFTLSFFIGLILASSLIIYKKIDNHKINNVVFGFIGLILGVVIAFVAPVSVTPTLPYIFLGGFLSISAMFLPGISGAFILLIMGIYRFMIGILKNLFENLLYFFVFSFGAILGAITISRVIVFLFKKDKSKTLYVLLGLVVGALSLPIKSIIKETLVIEFWNILILIFCFIVGIILVTLVTKFESKHGSRS